MSLADADIEIEGAEPPAPEHNIYRKQVWRCAYIDRIRKHGPTIAAHSRVTSAYFVPIGLLKHLGIYDDLRSALTAKPKSKKFQGRETRPPWPLAYPRGEWLACPRAFGCKVFGVPPAVDTTAGEMVVLAPERPLYNAETCVAAHGIDQETVVGNVERFLRAEVRRQGFGGCVFCASPGQGKTCMMAHLIARLGRRALFVVPNEKPFLKQVADEMQRFLGPGVRVGQMVTKEKRKWKGLDDAHIVITTAKSAATIPYDLSSFGTVIIDESHETITQMYSQMYFRYTAQYVVMLTATPERADHCGGYADFLCGPVVCNEERLPSHNRWGGIQVRVISINYPDYPIRDIVNRETGDTVWEAMTQQVLGRASRHAFLMGLITRLRGEGHEVLGLGSRVEQLEKVHCSLVEQERIPTGIVVGELQHQHSIYTWDEASGEFDRFEGNKMSADERQAQLRCPVVMGQVSIVYKALNKPLLSAAIVISGGPYATNMTYWKQLCGRINRDHAGKQPPVIIMLRDCYQPIRSGGEGIFARCIDAAVRTLHKYDPDGFTVTYEDVDL